MKGRLILTSLILLLLTTPLMLYSTSSVTVYSSVNDGNWNSKSNWDINKNPGSTINSGDTVHIYHNISFPQSLYINGVLIIHDGGSLECNGSKSIYIGMGGQVVAYGSVTVKDLYVFNTGSLTTYAAFYVSGTYNNSGEVNVETTNIYTGSLSIKGGKSSSSKVTFRRHIQADGWHYVAAPMDGVTTNKFWGGAVYSYNEPTKSWVEHKNNENMPLMKGYDIYFQSNHKVLKFKGTPNDSSHSIDVSYTSGTGDGYNLVGNPYCSSIDWDEPAGWTKTNINNAIYMWDDSLQNVATYINGVGTNTGTNIIPPTMAFFIKCNSHSGGMLTINKNAQIGQIENFREKHNDEILAIKMAGARYYDETIIRFSQNATLSYDADYDAEKMFSYNNQVPQIYTLGMDDQMLSVNSFKKPDESIHIPLYTTIKITGKYVLSFQKKSFGSKYTVLIEDVLTGKIHDINDGKYEFYSENNNELLRFMLHILPFNSIVNNNGVGLDDIKDSEPIINIQNEIVEIELPEIANRIEVKLTALSGQNLFNKTYQNSKSIKMSTKLINSNIYIVSILVNGKSYSKLFMK